MTVIACPLVSFIGIGDVPLGNLCISSPCAVTIFSLKHVKPAKEDKSHSLKLFSEIKMLKLLKLTRMVQKMNKENKVYYFGIHFGCIMQHC